jgi:hypothetical protein
MMAAVGYDEVDVRQSFGRYDRSRFFLFGSMK